jgi:hypothetical protein
VARQQIEEGGRMEMSHEKRPGIAREQVMKYKIGDIWITKRLFSW